MATRAPSARAGGASTSEARTVVIDREEIPLPPRPVEVAPSASHLPLPVPGGFDALGVGHPAATADSRPRMRPVGTGGDDIGGLPQPSAQEVLADVPGANVEPEPEGQFGWKEGRQRIVLVRRDPQFPRALGTAGVEVECTAKITVSPAGGVGSTFDK